MQPVVAETTVFFRGGAPFCGSCKRKLAHERQPRCPYVGCRKWLHGRNEKPPPKLKRPEGSEA